jgi:hypothetical protein
MLAELRRAVRSSKRFSGILPGFTRRCVAARPRLGRFNSRSAPFGCVLVSARHFRKPSDNAAQAGFAHPCQRVFNRAPAGLPNRLFRPAPALSQDLHRKDLDPATQCLSRLTALLIVERPERPGRHISGHARFLRRLMGCAIGRSQSRDRPAFRHDPAPRGQGCDQENLQIVLGTAPGKRRILDGWRFERDATHTHNSGCGRSAEQPRQFVK